MNKKETRNEAHKFLFDLLNCEIKLHTIDDDTVWDKIIKEIKEIKEHLSTLEKLISSDPM